VTWYVEGAVEPDDRRDATHGPASLPEVLHRFDPQQTARSTGDTSAPLVGIRPVAKKVEGRTGPAVDGALSNWKL
jgi:hypothetical protein